jgi:DNA-binding LacI/PurR family transcriptional regulator
MVRNGLEAEIRIVTGGVSEAEGAAAARVLFEDPPTAVAVFNDRSATGLLDVARQAGLRVPGDLSVIGYDDDRLAHLGYTDLTTIAQDAAEMTKLAVARAVARSEGEPGTPGETVTPPQLVRRGTTGPAPAPA